jgi:hypothetical protein
MACTSTHRGPNCSCFSAHQSASTSSEEVGRLIEIGAGEIEDEGARHDRHFDDPQTVVVMQHSGNGAAADVRNLALDQSQIHVAFAAIGALSLMVFDGRSAIFALAFDGKYVTMNCRSEGIAKNQTICLAVFLRAAKKLRWIAHECTADKSFGPLRGRADSLVRERPRLAGGAARPEVPDPENSRRSSSLRRRNCHVNRRPREPLGGAFAQWHSRGGAENRHFRSLTPTRTDQHFNSATALKPWKLGSQPCQPETSSVLQCGHPLGGWNYGCTLKITGLRIESQYDLLILFMDCRQAFFPDSKKNANPFDAGGVFH